MSESSQSLPQHLEHAEDVVDVHALTTAAETFISNNPLTETVEKENETVFKKISTQQIADAYQDHTELTSTQTGSKVVYELSKWEDLGVLKYQWSADPNNDPGTVTAHGYRGVEYKQRPMEVSDYSSVLDLIISASNKFEAHEPAPTPQPGASKRIGAALLKRIVKS